MSDKLKRVLDTNLAGLHVTDAQVNAVLRRVSQDEQHPQQSGRNRTLSLKNPAGQQNSIRSIAQKSKHTKKHKLSTSFTTANCRR